MTFFKEKYVRPMSINNKKLLSCDHLDKNKMPLITEVNMALGNVEGAFTLAIYIDIGSI